MVKKAQPKKKQAKPKAPARKTTKSRASDLVAADRAAKARRQRSLKAIGIYQRAVEALQRQKPRTAGPLFQKLIDEFPDEKELHERSRLYLEVCRRQEAPEPEPETVGDRIYAATLALNAGSEQEALQHLEAAAGLEPDSEQIHYMLAVAHAAAGAPTPAVTHLNRAIELNPDNRHLARHEAAFDELHADEAFRQILTPPSDGDGEPT